MSPTWLQPSEVMINLVRRYIAAKENDRDPEQQGTRCNNFGGKGSVVSGSQARQRTEGTGAVKQHQICSGDDDGHHFQLEIGVVGIEGGHANKEQNAGDDVNENSRNSPGNEPMQWSDRQLLQKSQYAQVQHSDRAQNEDQAD